VLFRFCSEAFTSDAGKVSIFFSLADSLSRVGR
jgi:hypothetical protein